MKVNEIGSGVPVEAESLFEIVNFYPSTTGLPMTVWVSPRGNAPIDVSVKVNITNGDQIDSAQAVIRWISLNTERWLRIGRGRSTQGSFVRC